MRKTILRSGAILFMGIMLPMSANANGDDHKRHHGAHEHGHGVLNIAIEGNNVEMEFETPAMDIVGFEHDPSTKEQHEAIEKATTTLSKDALSLFGLSKAAGCTIQKADVVRRHADEDHDEEHENYTKAEDDHDGDEDHSKTAKHDEYDHDHEENHSEFSAHYVMSCQSVDKISEISLGYFDEFAGAQTVEITVISDKGAFKSTATRDQPSVTLESM